MIITIHKPISIYSKGERDYNEDYIDPPFGRANVSDRLFLVCDGVGGAKKGEIASEFVATYLHKFFENAPYSDALFVESAILSLEKKLELHFQQYPDTLGMATTLALLHLHNNGATVAHIGDSRIYHIRKGQILYRSKDHSFVQTLISSGIITPQQAAIHPKRHIINRAIQGRHHPVKAETFVFDDIQAGDYFFLCTDGILEGITEETLTKLLNTTYTQEDIMAHISRACKAASKDNFSCYLIQIKTSNLEKKTQTMVNTIYQKIKKRLFFI